MLKKNYSGQFKKDYKTAIKRGLNINLLDDIIRQLCIPSVLPEKTKTIYCLVIGLATGNVTFNLIGY